MSMSQKMAELEDKRDGRVIPQWRYYVALFTGAVAITAARIFGRIEGAQGADANGWGFWVVMGIWMTFLVVFQASLIRYRRRALV